VSRTERRRAVRNRVRETRRALDLTQEDVCLRGPISKVTLIRVEGDPSHSPSYETMFILSRVLDKPIDYLFLPPVSETVDEQAVATSA
jgi:transcriptional regulator with XRE-family HTH domain